MLLVALISAGFGIVFVSRESHLRENGVRALGIVADRREEHKQDIQTRRWDTTRSLLVFYPVRGQTVQQWVTVPAMVHMKYHRTSQIEVIYDPSNPGTVAVVPEMGTMPVSLFGVSVLTFAGCVGAFVWSRKLRQEEAEPEALDLDEALRRARRRP